MSTGYRTRLSPFTATIEIGLHWKNPQQTAARFVDGYPKRNMQQMRLKKPFLAITASFRSVEMMIQMAD